MSISLYAEYLLNIRQVTIYATLKNLADKRLQAHVSSDRKTLSVAYDGASKTIEFPSGVAGKATVDLPVDAQEFLSLRLEIAEDEDADKPPHGVGMAVANDQPWSAASLSPDVEMACRACAAALVRPGVVKEWRDLPRKGWAEAMDMWHCHKPAGSTNGTHPARDGKYGVLEGLVLQGETGLVDTCHFLVPEGACVGIKVRSSFPLRCDTCKVRRGGKKETLSQGFGRAMKVPPIQLPETEKCLPNLPPRSSSLPSGRHGRWWRQSGRLQNPLHFTALSSRLLFTRDSR